MLSAVIPYGVAARHMPCRTTGRLEAAATRSFRTWVTFPSGGPHPPWVESDLSHDGLNPAHVPL
ncbi:hypothetical protein ATG_18950 [Desulfurococcaceae archaeon AG1]|nr:hypothetical protein ATG_18950 [Desulfurococcaceae archaeon AG1]